MSFKMVIVTCCTLRIFLFGRVWRSCKQCSWLTLHLPGWQAIWCRVLLLYSWMLHWHVNLPVKFLASTSFPPFTVAGWSCLFSSCWLFHGHLVIVSCSGEYFSLGGCSGPGSKYFTLGGCAGPEIRIIVRWLFEFLSNWSYLPFAFGCLVGA